MENLVMCGRCYRHVNKDDTTVIDEDVIGSNGNDDVQEVVPVYWCGCSDQDSITLELNGQQYDVNVREISKSGIIGAGVYKGIDIYESDDLDDRGYKIWCVADFNDEETLQEILDSDDN